jgi:hypothetical protein
MKIKTISIGGILSGFILLAIAFQAIAAALPEVYAGGKNIGALGLPFASFFNSGGLIYLAIMGALVLLVLGAIGLYKGNSR